MQTDPAAVAYPGTERRQAMAVVERMVLFEKIGLDRGSGASGIAGLPVPKVGEWQLVEVELVPGAVEVLEDAHFVGTFLSFVVAVAEAPWAAS